MVFIKQVYLKVRRTILLELKRKAFAELSYHQYKPLKQWIEDEISQLEEVKN